MIYIDVCPFCGDHVEGAGEEFGGRILHQDCYRALQDDFDEVEAKRDTNYDEVQPFQYLSHVEQEESIF